MSISLSRYRLKKQLLQQEQVGELSKEDWEV